MVSRPHHVYGRQRSWLVMVVVLALLCGFAGLLSPAEASTRYAVTISAPASSPLVNTPFLLTGHVSPAAPGAKVDLERKSHGTWRTVGSGKLSSGSTYEFAQVFGAVGGYPFRVRKSAAHKIGKGVSPVARVWVTGSALHPNVVMRSGDTLLSPGGSYRMTMQPTGDVTVSLTSTRRTIWSFGTGGHSGATAVLHDDGDFIVRDAQGTTIKETNTGGHPVGDFTLDMLDTSNLVILGPRQYLWWSSDTLNSVLNPRELLAAGQYLLSSDRQYELLMQPDGNLVILDLSSGDTIWETDTYFENSHVTMQTDGNLTVYGPRGKLRWQSNTSGHAGAVATMRTDGNLVVSLHGTALWASKGLGGIIGDDYPSNLRDAPRDSIIDPWRFYNRECTSFVAWRMNSANGVAFNNFMDGGRFGDAGNWDDNARALGFTVDAVPARGAIAESDAEGHVAWVAAVGTGTVTVEEYNYAAPGVYGYRTVPTSHFVYIHIKDL